MHSSVISDEKSVGPNLFSPIGITDTQQSALWNDPDFGLKDPNNFVRWDALVYVRDPVLFMQFINELKLHFGLTHEQVIQCQANWNSHFTESLDFIGEVTPQSDSSPA